MLAASVDDVPLATALPGGAQYEPKFDGWRGCLLRTADGAQLRARSGRDLSALFPELVAAAVEQLEPGTTLDGELVVWSGSRVDFAALQRRTAARTRIHQLAAASPANFLAFDLLDLAGADQRPRPLRERRERLETLMAGAGVPLQLVPATTDRDLALAWLRDYARARVGVEGLVIKALGQPYQPGRRGWLKHKTYGGVDAVIGAVTGSAARPERLILGLPDADGDLRIAGSTLPLKPAQVREVAALVEPLDEARHPWSHQLLVRHLSAWTPSRSAVVTVRPEVVAEVATGTGNDARQWREQARYLRVRTDLAASDLDPDLDPRTG
jgi:ATP-dependent DNA ligase